MIDQKFFCRFYSIFLNHFSLAIILLLELADVVHKEHSTGLGVGYYFVDAQRARPNFDVHSTAFGYHFVAIGAQRARPTVVVN